MTTSPKKQAWSKPKPSLERKERTKPKPEVKKTEKFEKTDLQNNNFYIKKRHFGKHMEHPTLNKLQIILMKSIDTLFFI